MKKGSRKRKHRLLGYFRKHPVDVCVHRAKKSPEKQELHFRFFGLQRSVRDSLLDALSESSDEQPLQARIIAYRDFRFKERSQRLCVHRDIIHVDVFAQENTFSDPAQHLQLMLWVFHQALQKRMPKSFWHLSPSELAKQKEKGTRSQLKFFANALEAFVLNTGAFLGWNEEAPTRAGSGAFDRSSLDLIDEDDEDILFEEDDLQFLRSSHKYEEHCRERIRSLFDGLQPMLVWNPMRVGSLSPFAEDDGEYYKERISDALRIRMLDEKDQLM